MRICILILVITAFAANVFGQADDGADTADVQKIATAVINKDAKDDGMASPEPMSCEMARVVMDKAFVDFQKLSDDSLLIIIVRRGKDEKGSGLVSERMSNIEKAIRFRHVTDRYILAEGPAAESLGTAEIYIAGKLVAVIHSPKEGKLCEPYPPEI